MANRQYQTPIEIVPTPSGPGGTVTSVGTAGIATGGPITTTGTVTVLGSGNTTTAATANSNLASAPNGDVVTTDGSGNVKDSGTLLSSLAPLASPTFTGTVVLPSGTVTWDQIGNAAGNLTLSNAGNTTTFNQTSAITWLWANTTAATSGTPQSSPFLALNGTWWGPTSGANATAVSQTDGWTIEDVTAATTVNTNISNISETSGLVTLTISSGTFTSANTVLLAGLTTATWLNGQYVYLLTANATTLTFIDPTNHADQGSTSETGSVFFANSTLQIKSSVTNSFNAPQARINLQASTINLVSTPAATSTSNNHSPLLALASNYWNGSSSLSDVWNLRSFVAAGTNGASGLFVSHAGSSGAATVGLPSALSVSWNFGSTTSTGDTGISRISAGTVGIGTGAQGSIAGNLQLSKITNYAGSATTKNGVAPILFTSIKTAQAAAQSAASIVASTPAVGMWRISFVATITTAASAAGVLGGATGFTITYTNGNGDSVSKTTALSTPLGIGASNSTSDSASGDLYCYAGSATAISYSYGYTAGTGTAMQYDIAVYAEFLG